MHSPLVASFLIYLQLAGALINNQNYLCELNWMSSGYGEIPANSVLISNAINSTTLGGEYIGRIKLNRDEWILGRITRDGNIHAINPYNNAKPTISSTYQILTKNDNCNLIWVADQLNPKYAVKLYKNGKVRYNHYVIGRVRFAGQWIVGIVNTKINTITFTHDGDIYDRVDYEILTSTYHKLGLELSNFEFHLNSHALSANTSQIVIGDNWIDKKESSIRFDQSIFHSRQLLEIFKIENAEFLNCNLASLNLDMSMWYSTDPVKHEFTIFQDDGDNGDLLIERVKNVSTSSEIRMDPKTSESNTLLHVISTASVFHGSIPFTAKGKVLSSGSMMTSQTIQKLVSNCNLHIIGKDERSVSVSVEGVLHGQFITAIESSVTN